MPKKPGAYYRPENLDEALKVLSQPDTAPLAGGTELLAKEAGVNLAAVVDLQDLGLGPIDVEAGQLRIGSMVTLGRSGSISAKRSKIGGRSAAAAESCSSGWTEYLSQCSDTRWRNCEPAGGQRAVGCLAGAGSRFALPCSGRPDDQPGCIFAG